MIKYLLILWVVFTGIYSCKTELNESRESTTAIKEDTINFVKTIQLTGNKQLAFTKIDTNTNLFYSPYIIIKDKPFLLKGFPSNHGSYTQPVALSPSSRYLIIDEVLIDQAESDSASCVVIDLLQKKVIRTLINGCEGEWNAQEQWVSEGQIILSFD